MVSQRKTVLKINMRLGILPVACIILMIAVAVLISFGCALSGWRFGGS